jgi:N-acetylglutamate synthase
MSGATTGTVDGHRLEEAGINMLQTSRQLFYDGWLLRLLPGRTRRARSVSALFASTLPLATKIEHCEAVYRQQGLPVLFRITPFDRPAELDRALAARGYLAFDRTLVQLAPLVAPPEYELSGDVVIAKASAAEFTLALAALKDGAAQSDPPRDPASETPLPARAIVARIEDRPVAAGQAALDGRLAGIGNVATAPDMRGRGLATAVVGALLAWAWGQDATHAFLQVDVDNHRAHAVYGRYGFTTVHAYHYRGRPEEGQ